MNFRITTNMMMNTYRYNLQNATRTRDLSSTKVQTRRNFNSFAEDPAAATHAWRLRRAYSRNENYITSNTEATTRFETAKSAMETIDDKMLNETKGAKAAIKYADNDPTGGARTALGRVLRELGESVIFTMNGAKYGDHFVFSGNDEMNAPFSWSEDGKTLYYRGVNVGAGAVKDPSQQPDWGHLVPKDMPADSLNEDEKAWIKYYQDPDWQTSTPPDSPKPAWAAPDPAADTDLIPIKVLDWGPLVPKEMPAAGAKGNTQADEDWIAYYTKGDMTAPEPASPKPDWADSTMVPLDKRDVTDYELAWYEAALNGGQPDPSTPPGWDITTDPYGAPLDGDTGVQWDPENMSTIERAWYAYYNDQADAKKLDAMAAEHEFMDLGMGLQEIEDRDLINSTAFDRSLPGLNMLGYGVDEDGDPKNLALLMKKFDHVLSQVDENGTVPEVLGGNQRVIDLLGKFDDVCDFTLKGYTNITTEAKFLTSNTETLESQTLNLNEQIVDLEQVDLADAITQFMWDYNCYNAALKIGTQLLSQSLLDYMS